MPVLVPQLCVNDLEAPSFSRLPELAELKRRLWEEGRARGVQASFMTGSGSTMVALGISDELPFLSEPKYKDLFKAKARFITRKPGEWFQPRA